jgi:hypothetical protein
MYLLCVFFLNVISFLIYQLYEILLKLNQIFVIVCFFFLNQFCIQSDLQCQDESLRNKVGWNPSYPVSTDLLPLLQRRRLLLFHYCLQYRAQAPHRDHPPHCSQQVQCSRSPPNSPVCLHVDGAEMMRHFAVRSVGARLELGPGGDCGTGRVRKRECV